MNFSIVEFISSKEVEVVPAKWLFSGNQCIQCHWPSYKAARLRKAVIFEEEPIGDSWSLYDVKLLKSFDSYDEARAKLSLAENTDNLDSETAEKEIGDGVVRSSFRRKKSKRPFESSASSDDDCDREPSVNKKAFRLPAIEFPDKNNKAPGSLTIPQHPSSPGSSTSTVQPEQSSFLDGSLSSSCADKTADYLNKIVKRLETICAVQEQHSIILQELMANSKVSLDVGSTERPDGMPNLPLRSMNELEEWEAFINCNRANYTYACKLLTTVGGGSVAQATRRMMKRLITSDLALSFNWAGRAPKKPFKVLGTTSLILDAVKKSISGSTVGVEANVEAAIKDWLKYAGVRVTSAERQKVIIGNRPTATKDN